jgi:RNA polymerase sigma factor for flagellar operon FliA
MISAATGATVEQRKIEEELVREHLPLVHYAVSEMAAKVPRHVSRDDLVSAGMAGLAQAARSFDPERGIAFDRYASTRIRGALLDELRDRDWASRSVRSKARRVATATDDLTAKLGRAPSNDEVAGHLGLEARTIDALNEDVHRAVVLNYDSMLAQGDAEDVMPSNHITPDSVMLDRERRAYLLDAITALPERLRRVVIGYFFEERSMQDIAEELGVSESRISQMRAEALVLLKDGMNSQLDPDALPIEAKPSPRVARRRAAYYAAIASASDYRTRLNAAPVVSAAPVRTTA